MGAAATVKTHIPPLDTKPRQPSGWMRMDRKLFVFGLFVVMGLVLCLIFGSNLKREYDNEIAAASARTQNLTKILEGYTRQSMRRVESHLSQAADQISVANDTSAAGQASQLQRLTALLPIDGLIRSFVVIDTKGVIVASTAAETVLGLTTVADRDYFVSQREHPSRKLFVGAATKSRITGYWIIPVSVALTDSAGTFQGVLVGNLDPEYLQRFYDTLDTGSNGFVTLFTRTGMIAARSPFVESLLQRSWIDSPMFREHLPTSKAKTVRQVVAADGVERLYSYRALDDYPLVVSMGVSLTDSLAPWRLHALSEGLFLLFLLAVLGLTAFLLVQQQQERRRFIHRLQESEMRRGVATDSGRVAIWEVDLKTNTLVWDDNCFLLYRMRKEDFKGAFEEWSQTIHPQDVDAVLLAFQNAVAGIAKFNLTFRILWPDGSVRHIKAHGDVLKNNGGVPERVIGTNWDITEQKLNEETLKSSVQEKSALLKEVHHRVKNNLQVITSLLRLESRRSVVEDTKVVLGEMQARIRAMALLYESLYRSGTFASVDLGSYLRQLATQAFQTQSTNSGAVQLELNLGSVQVSMDQAIPCGLLINELISNCLKHGFPDGAAGHVSIDLEPQESERQWCLRVRDTGAGLPVDFEEKRQNSLGLLLAGDLARQIGGALQITPNGDQGVSFTVIFLALEPKPLVMPA
jgi:two-component sensor histidine kinase/PAS domain-containing protein